MSDLDRKIYSINDAIRIENIAYNQALKDALNVVEWDGYTLDIKERIERLKK